MSSVHGLTYMISFFPVPACLTNRFCVSEQMFSSRSQMTACGKNKRSDTQAVRRVTTAVTDVPTAFWRLL